MNQPYLVNTLSIRLKRCSLLSSNEIGGGDRVVVAGAAHKSKSHQDIPPEPSIVCTFEGSLQFVGGISYDYVSCIVDEMILQK